MLQEPSRPFREVTALQLLGTRVWLSPRQSTLTRVLTELCRNCNMRKSKFFNPIWAMDILFLSYFPYLLFLISLIHYRQHSDGMKKLDQAVKDVDYYRQVCVCMYYFIIWNMDPCSLRRLKISGQDTMTWSWRSRDWTRRWSVSAGELANSMSAADDQSVSQ